MSIKEFRLAARQNAERYCMFLACCAFVFDPVKNAAITGIRTVVSLPFHADTIACYGLLLYFVLRAAPYIIENFPWEELLAFALLYAYALLSMVMAQSSLDSGDYRITVFFDLLGGSLLYYAVFRVCPVNERTLKYLGIAALLGIVAQYFNAVVWPDYSITKYSQYLGYATLPSEIICISVLFFAQKARVKILFLVGSLIGFLVLVSCGARGPLLIALLWLVVNCFIGVPLKLGPRLAISAVLGAILMIAFFNLDQIMSWLQNVLSSFGVSGRIFDMYDKGSLTEDEARSRISIIATDYITSHILIGSGIGNDRAVIAGEFFAESAYGSYPHNIVLEILMQFGLLAGTIIILLLAALIAHAFWKGDAQQRMILGILLCTGLLPLMFSASYTDWPLFFALLGFSVSVVRGAKQNVAEEKAFPSAEV